MRLAADAGTLHGHYDPALPVALTVDPGDTVTVECLDSGWSVGPFDGGDLATRERHPAWEPGAGHALTGPIAVRGARPGQVLAVRVDDVVPGAFGTTYCGLRDSALNRRLGVLAEPVVLRWTIDGDTATTQHGHTVATRPFLGVLGLPPAEPGRHSTVPPRWHGGNLDCRELVAGATLYLPVTVPGALLSVGDGHAAQGDGEVSGTAIECPVEATLTLELREDLHGLALRTPVADTPAGWVCMGVAEDLDTATGHALDAVLDLMGALHGIGRSHALALASVLVDLRVTQVVNGRGGRARRAAAGASAWLSGCCGSGRGRAAGAAGGDGDRQPDPGLLLRPRCHLLAGRRRRAGRPGGGRGCRHGRRRRGEGRARCGGHPGRGDPPDRRPGGRDPGRTPGRCRSPSTPGGPRWPARCWRPAPTWSTTPGAGSTRSWPRSPPRPAPGIVCTHAGGLPPRTRPHRIGYPDVLADIVTRTTALAEAAVAAGVDPERVLIDPGHDFGKNTRHSLEATRRLGEMVDTGWPVLVALSNKDFIGETLGVALDERLTGTLAATAVSAWLGARVFRAHDVAPTRQTLDMVASIRGDRPPLRTARGLA